MAAILENPENVNENGDKNILREGLANAKINKVIVSTLEFLLPQRAKRERSLEFSFFFISHTTKL